MRTRPKLLEEIFNSVIHGMGFFVFLFGFVIYFFLHTDLTIWKMVGVSIFGTSILLLYCLSTLYHSLIFTKAKRVFLSLDGAAIFLLIAGTYTPFLMTVLRGSIGWILLVIVWLIAAFGMVLHVIFTVKVRKVTLTLCLLLGWSVLFAIKPLYNAVSKEVFWLLIGGGVLYTIGSIFYMRRKLPFSHTVWHLFVTAGSLFHFWAIYLLYY